MKVNVLVLNYNGKALLGECLPSIINAREKSHHCCEIVIVDNGSSDGSINLVKEHFQEVSVFASYENRCLSSFNEVAEQMDSDILILLNNDVKVEPDFIDPLVVPFLNGNGKLFMTSPQCWQFDRKTYEGTLSVPRLRWGMLGTEARFSGWEKQHKIKSFTISSGVCLAVDRRKFLDLGGYDSLYLPGTLEDLDLCYRAWKRGWQCLYIPQSVVYHKSQATFKSAFGTKEIRRIASRNTFFFMWKNITDKALLAKHFFCILPRLIYAGLNGDIPFISGFFSTFPKLGEVLAKRHETEKSFSYSDGEILQKFGFPKK